MNPYEGKIITKKFKRRSIRLPEYDYSKSGAYFITICSFNKELIFGKITDGKIILSEIGKIVKMHLKEIPKSIGSIIRAYKASVTTWCRKNEFPKFKWQRNYFEHIIRNEEDHFRIKEYIQNNPLQWELDEENPKHKNFTR